MELMSEAIRLACLSATAESRTVREAAGLRLKQLEREAEQLERLNRRNAIAEAAE